MKTYNQQFQNYPKTYLQSSYQFDAQQSNSQVYQLNSTKDQLQQQKSLQQQQQPQQQLYILQQKKNQGNLTDPRPGVQQQSMNYSYQQQQQNQNQENSISPQSFQKQLNQQNIDPSPIRSGNQKVINLKQVQENGQQQQYMNKSPIHSTPQSKLKQQQQIQRQNSANSINQFSSVQMKSEMDLIKDENLNLKAQRKIDQEELDFWKKKCEEFQVRIQKEMRTNFNLREQQSTQASSAQLRDSTPTRLNSSVSSMGASAQNQNQKPKQQLDEKLIKEYEREARLKDQQIEQLKKELETNTTQFEHLHKIYEEQRTLNGKLQIQIMDNGEEMAKLKERFQRLEKKFTERSALKPSNSLSLSPSKRVQFGKKSNIESVHQVEKYIQEQQCLNHTPSPSPDHGEIQDHLDNKYERLMDSIDPNSPLKQKRQREQQKQQSQQEKENQQISKFDEYEEKLKSQKEKRAKLEDEFKQRDSFTTSDDRRSRYNYGAHSRTTNTGNINGNGVNQPPAFNINSSKIVNDRIKAQQQLLNKSQQQQNQENDYQQAKKNNQSTRQEENPLKSSNHNNNKGQYTNYKPQFTHQRQASDGYASDRLNVFNDSGKKQNQSIYSKQNSLGQDYINGLLDEQNIKNSMLLLQSKKLMQNEKPKYTFTSPYKSYLEEINNRKE